MFKFTELGNPIVDYLKVSPNAALHIAGLLSQRKEPCEGIRIGVRTRGCSGLSYTIEYAVKDQNITRFDDVVIFKNEASNIENAVETKVFIDPKVSMFLIGSEMIYKSDQLSAGFDFVNPNEKGRCGCGESFAV